MVDVDVGKLPVAFREIELDPFVIVIFLNLKFPINSDFIDGWDNSKTPKTENKIITME